MKTPDTSPLAASMYSGNGMGQYYTDPDHLVVRRSVDLVSQTGAQNVLDLACGAGIVSLALCNETNVRDIVAVDINDPAVTRLQEQANFSHYPIRAYIGSAAGELPEDTYGTRDVVIAKDLYPFLDPESADAMLENVAGSLAYRGWLLLTAPSVRSRLYAESTPASKSGHFYRKIGPDAQAFVQTDLEHFLFTDIHDLSSRLDNNGLEVTEAQHFGRAGGWIMAIAQKLD